MPLRRQRLMLLALSLSVLPLGAGWPRVSAAVAPAPDYQFGVVEATQALPQAEGLGIGWTRVPMFWNNVQPTPNSWNSNYTDQDRGLLNLAQDGIVPVGVVQTVPAWASTDAAQSPNGVPKGLSLPWNNPHNTWGQFMYQLARHYAGLINTWIIGNEISIPSGPYHTFDGSVNQMAEMIRTAYLAVHAANPSAQIQAPGAPYWYTHGNTTNTLLTDLSHLPGAAQNHDYIDGINLHLYNTIQFNQDIYARYQQILKIHGLSGLPIWLTEANASPQDGSHAGVTLAQQSDFLIEDLASSLADVTRVEVYQMKDPKVLSGPEGPTGLITQRGTARPAYTAVRTLIQSVSGTTFLGEKLHLYHGYSPSTPAVVSFGGVERLVQVVWDQGFAAATVHLQAYAPQAEVLTATGTSRPIAASHGQFILTLAPSTDHSSSNIHDAPIGGAPLIVIQRVARGQAGTPLSPPANAPTEFSGPTPAMVVRRGDETARMNPENATVTMTEASKSVTVGGWGTRAGQFLGLSGITIAPSGVVYVTSSGNQKVSAFRPNGTLSASWGSYGASPGQFNGPSGIVVGTQGTVYVADTLNQRIQAFTSTGSFKGQVATPWPSTIHFLATGRLSVTDAMTQKTSIVQFPTSKSLLPAPADVTAMAVNPNGEYAVATGKSQVMVYTSTGHLIHTWTIPPAYGNRVLPSLTSLAWSGSTLYVVDGRYNRILAIKTALNPVPIQVTSSGLLDQSTVAVLPLSGSLLLGPEAVAVGANGNLWVADTDRQQVLCLNPLTGAVLSRVRVHDGPDGLASLANGDIVVAGYYGDTLTELSANGSLVWRSGAPGSGPNQLRHPTTVVSLPDGNIAVWDTGNHRAVLYASEGTPNEWIQAPSDATAMSALPSGDLLWATPSGLMPVEP